MFLSVSFGFAPLVLFVRSLSLSLAFRTIISQLVYTFGGSAFPGATSSMIIEVIPFFHIMAAEIVARVGDGEGSDKVIIATTMVAFALSSILTGKLTCDSE